MPKIYSGWNNYELVTELQARDKLAKIAGRDFADQKEKLKREIKNLENALKISNNRCDYLNVGPFLDAT